MSQAQRLYRNYQNESDPLTQVRVQYLLRLEAILLRYGVELNWPAPPFDDSFDEKIQKEHRFQIQWSIQILECLSNLFPSEDSLCPVPPQPYTTESITRFVDEYRHVLENRSLWKRLFGNGALSEEQHALLINLKHWAEVEMHEFQAFWTPKLQAAARRSSLSACVSAGVFLMGPPESKREVTIGHDIIVMKHPVKIGLYKEIMGEVPSLNSHKGSEYPVGNMTWFDAITFANKMSEFFDLGVVYRGVEPDIYCDWSSDGWRLPTEAEWEYLARGGESYIYAGSDNIDDVAWFYKNSEGKTHPVGRKQANGFGLYDMSGNVSEWCWDWYGPYSEDAERDPKGPYTGIFRVHRGGGALYSDPTLSTVYARRPGPPHLRVSGFRLVRTVFKGES